MKAKEFAALDLEEAADLIDIGLQHWHHNCHVISLAIVKSGILGHGVRVARGSCQYVPNQHSWVTSADPYDDEALVLDPTLWTYNEGVTKITIGTLDECTHTPHGYGSIWGYGYPIRGHDEVITLKGESSLSDDAKEWLDRFGPLDFTGWAQVAHCPAGGGRPAGEIWEAMYNTPSLKALVPIDRLGMATNLNPDGLYISDSFDPTDTSWK